LGYTAVLQYYYSRKVKFFEVKSDNDHPQVHPSTYFRLAQLQSFALFPSLRHLVYDLDDRSTSHTTIFLFLSPLLESLELSNIEGLENTIVGPFLATLSSQMLNRIVIRFGRMSVDILKTSIVHFKQLRSLELFDAVFMSNFDLWKVLGTLPSLADLTLSIDPTCHPTHVSENSNGRSGVPKYFYALENLSVTGSFFLIQHLLSSIDSPFLKSIEVYPVDDNYFHTKPEPEDSFTPSMKIVASKWSQSLKTLVIGRWSSVIAHRNTISKCLMLLTVLHEMQTFDLMGWSLPMGNMENMDNDMSCHMRRLAMSWPKLRTLKLPLNQTFISLWTLRIIAENCPELRHLQIRLDTSTIPPFNTSSKSLRHKLEVLTVGRAHPSDSLTQTMLEYQIQVTRYLDFIFPYLKSIEVQPMDEIWSAIHNLLKLCQDAATRRQRK
jgi:hypothetical protein